MKLNPMVETIRVAGAHGGEYGLFKLPFPSGETMVIIVDNGETTGWEHVSCSFVDRTPLWDEMARVKNLFWGADECVVQFHPPAKDYVNVMPYCLHLWRQRGTNWETPPRGLIA